MKKMFTYVLLTVTLTSFSFVSGDVYSTCYEYETYCLFSFGPNVTVNNVNEAQKICKDAKNGSWLLEIVDNRTLKNVDEFLSKYSFPENTKLILNAEKVGNEWKWIRSKSGFTFNNNKSSNDLHYYQRSKQTGQNANESDQFSSICMTGCSSDFIKHDMKRYLGATGYKIVTTEECREKCETSTCEAYEWDRNSDPDYNNCWIHETIHLKNMSDNTNGTLYKINRSNKTTDVCVGNITEPTPGIPHPNGNHGTNNDVRVLFIIPVILLLATIFFAVIIFWRSRKKRKECLKPNFSASAPSAYSEPLREGSSPTTPSPHRIETEQQNNQMKSIVYADLQFFQKDNKTSKELTIVGPMGDVYAQVHRK